MIKDENIDLNCPCPCYKKRCTGSPAGFEKIMDLKSAGLVIYRHIAKPANKHQRIAFNSEAGTSGYILHKTKSNAVVSKEYLEEMMEKEATECKRCRQIMQHAFNLLQIVSALSNNDIIGVCDHCKLSDHPCFDCDDALNKFFEAQQSVITKEKVREWLKNVQNEFKKYFDDEKQTTRKISMDTEKYKHSDKVQPRARSEFGRYFDDVKENVRKNLTDFTKKYEHSDTIRPRARSEVCIDRLRRKRHDRDERKLEISELCRESIEQDLAIPAPALTDKNKKQIISNFIDHLDELYSTLKKSSTRKLKSDLPKKQRADYYEDDFIQPSHTFRHEQVIEKQLAYGPVDEVPKKGFVFSFPRDEEKKGKLEKDQQLKSSSELISDIHDRIEQKNEAIRLKQKEEEEIKQRAQEEKNKLLEEEKRLAEAKMLMEKKENELFKDTRTTIDKSKIGISDRIGISDKDKPSLTSSSTTVKKKKHPESEVDVKEMKTKSKSQLSKSEQVNDTEIKEKEAKSASKLTSKHDTSRMAKADVVSSKTEQEKIKREPPDSSKPKTTTQSENVSEGAKQHKTEAKSLEKGATLGGETKKDQKSSQPGDEPKLRKSEIKETKTYPDERGKAIETEKHAEIDLKHTKTDQDKGHKADQGKSDKADQSKGDKADQSKGDKADQSKGDKADQSKGDKADQSKGDKADQIKGDKADQSKGDKAYQSKGDKADQSKGDKADQSKGDKATKTSKTAEAELKESKADQSKSGKTAKTGKGAEAELKETKADQSKGGKTTKTEKGAEAELKETKADQGKSDKADQSKGGKGTKTGKGAEVESKETKADQTKGGKGGNVKKTSIDTEIQNKEKAKKEKSDGTKTEKYEEETKKGKGSKKEDVITIHMEKDKGDKTAVNLTAGTKKEKVDGMEEKKDGKKQAKDDKKAKDEKKGKDDKAKFPEENRIPRRQLEAQQAAAAAAAAKAAAKAKKTQTKVTEAKRIQMLKQSQNFMVLDLVKMKPPKQTLSQIVSPSQMHIHDTKHHITFGDNCPLCKNSNLALEHESRKKRLQEQEEMIKGRGIRLLKAHKDKEEIVIKPMLFQINYDDNFISDYIKPLQHIPVVREHARPLIEKKSAPTLPEEESKGVIHYALSDRTYIEKGWTKLPTEKVVRKMNVYRMRPAHPEFDWFQHNKKKGQLLYDTGERLAEFDDDGHGRWFYRNQRLALQYYDAEEINAQQRFVIYSNGEPDERGRSRPYTVLATFDYLGNGIVFDHSGKIRLKYNQTEGVVLDRNIGPATHWKWHTLNDPPVLQQVMIDTNMAHKDPTILKMATPHDKEPRPDNEDMLAIEFDNFIKEKSKKLKQKFKPFQIHMKAMKINENFSLKVLDQAHVYLIYRDGTTNIKVNLGMLLDHKEIVDTDTAEVGEVANNMERLPPRTDSMAAMQRSIAFAQQFERSRTERERRIRPTVPIASVEKLASAASRPVRIPLRACSSITPSSYPKSRKPSSTNVYYDNRLL